MFNQQKKKKKRFVMGCAQWYGLQPCLPENKFSATMPTTHTALRADKTEQKVELRSSKNASLNKKPSGLIAIAQLIMCCKTINNNFRNLNDIIQVPTF
jgi:hypothetical protein